MPPRRAAQKAPTGSASTSLASNIQDITARIQQGVSTWTENGRAEVQSALQSLLDQVDSTSLGPILLSNALVGIIKSDLTLKQLVEAFSSLMEEFAEDVKEDKVLHLGEALVDVVEVFQEFKEDTSDLRAENDAMDQDGSEKPMSIEDKGVELLKTLITSGHIPAHVANLLLSPDLLVRLSLHPYPSRPELLQRAYVKRNTTLFFKQSKYNLLRESSEGFSALVVLLTGSDAFSSRAKDESEIARKRRAEQVWGKIMGLIGYFNLSPPRVLDLILEVASCQIAAQWKFLLDLLRCSPWGNAEKVEGKGKERAKDQWMDDETMAIEHALDASGDRVLCQVLGVKFGFYQRQDGGETPYGLVVMSALLVKHGLVGLSDLMAFLSPDDAQMKPIHDAYLASTNSRSGPSNALSNSVLIDDEEGASSTTKAEDSGPPPKPPPEQRIMLLQALLAIGDLASAMVILARFPWLAQSHPAIADLIMRNVAYALEPLYEAIRQRLVDEDGEINEEIALPGYPVTNRQQLTPTYLFPQPPDTPASRYEFFYPGWKDDLDQWTSVDDLLHRGLRWLGLIRGTAGRQVDTMVKICRIGASSFAALRREKEVARGLVTGAKTKEEIQSVEPSHDEMKPWLDLVRLSLLPALSTSSGTAAFDVELWYLLRHLPYPVRYSLYGEWRDSTCRPIGRNPCPAASHAAAEATREIKKALSRVTASQSAPSGPAASTDRGPARALAKLSHSNPHALWATAVTQVKAYPNIGQFIVEAGRYMTQMSTDVAMFTLVDTLSDDTVSRLNPNGTDVAQWLASLATFVGDFNRRYASMDLEPVLQFIINRLMRSDSADLTILDKLISIMTGVAQIENDAISDEQLQAYATGREMVKEAFNTTLISIARPTDPTDATAKPKGAPIDKARSTKRSLPRLINALRFTELAMPIWIALGQTRQGAVDKMASAPIKAISAMQDTVHGTFVQYGDLLAEYLSTEEHVNLTPDLASLVSEYGLDFSVAFLILRPRLNAELAKARSAREAAVKLKLAAAKEHGLRASLSPSQENSPLPSPRSPSMEIDEREDAVQPNGNEEAVTIPAPRPQPNKSWYPSSLRKPMEQARDLLPHDVNEVMGAPFFVIFWHLTMGDIAYSPEAYDKAIAKITAMDRDVSTWRTTAVSEQKSERVRLKARIEVLSKEKEAQAGAVDVTKRRLGRESKHWFGSFVLDKGLQRKLSYQLHQHCFYPRALLTPADAVYVARFIRVAHDLGTVGFPTLFVYENFFSDALPGCIFSSTTNEARNFGRCLAAIMSDLDLWHKDEKRYKREALGVDPENPDIKELPGMLYRSRRGTPISPMTYISFREVYAKWHNTLTKALLSCWTEKDFMHIKNGITVAIQVIKSYPVMKTSGVAIESAVKDLIAGKNGTLTPDLQHQCQAYLRMLNQRKTTRPYVQPGSFHAGGIKLNDVKPAPVVKSASGTPAPANGDVKPNGAAAPTTTTADPKALRAKLEENKASRSASAATAAAAAAAAAASSTPNKEEANVKAEPEKSTASPAPSAPPAGPRASRSTTSLPPAPTGPSSSIRGHASSSSTDRVPTGPARAPPAAPAASTRNTSSMGPPASTSLTVDEERAAARARKFGTLTRPQPPSGPSAGTKPEGVATSVGGNTSSADTRKTQSPAPSPAHQSGRSGSIESGTTERSARERERRESRDRRTSEDKKDTSRELLPDKENGARSRTPVDKAENDSERRRLSREAAKRDEKDKDDRSTGKPERESFSTRSRRREEETPRRIDDPRDRDREKDRDHRHRRRDERDDRDSRDGRTRRDERPEDRRDERDRRRRDREEPSDRRPSRDLPPHADNRPREPVPARESRTRDRDSKPPEGAPRTRDPPPHELARDDRDRRGARTDDKPNGGRTPRRDEPSRTNGQLSVPSGPSGPHGDRIIEAPRSTRSNERDARLPARPDPSRSTRAGSNNPPPSTVSSTRATHALPARPGAASGERRSPAPSGRNGSSLASRMGPPASAASATSPPERAEPTDRGDRDRAPDLRKRPHEDTPPAREDSPGASKRVKIDRDKARSHDRRGREGREGGSKMLSSAVKSATE